MIEANIIPQLVHILSSAEFDIKKEAAWAICNATAGGSEEETKFIVSCGSIPPICELLVCQDNRVIKVALEGLYNILRVGDAEKELAGPGGVNPYISAVDGCGGLDNIQELQEHPHDEIYEKAYKILVNYFDVGDGSNDEEY